MKFVAIINTQCHRQLYLLYKQFNIKIGCTVCCRNFFGNKLVRSLMQHLRGKVKDAGPKIALPPTPHFFPVFGPTRTPLSSSYLHRGRNRNQSDIFPSSISDQPTPFPFLTLSSTSTPHSDAKESEAASEAAAASKLHPHGDGAREDRGRRRRRPSPKIPSR